MLPTVKADSGKDNFSPKKLTLQADGPQCKPLMTAHYESAAISLSLSMSQCYCPIGIAPGSCVSPSPHACSNDCHDVYSALRCTGLQVR